jgi:hypothetical protein
MMSSLCFTRGSIKLVCVQKLLAYPFQGDPIGISQIVINLQKLEFYLLGASS